MEKKAADERTTRRLADRNQHGDRRHSQHRDVEWDWLGLLSVLPALLLGGAVANGLGG